MESALPEITFRFVSGRKLELLRDCGIGEIFQFVHPSLSRAMEEINGWMDGPTAIMLVSKGRGSVDIGGAGEEGEFSRAAF